MKSSIAGFLMLGSALLLSSCSNDNLFAPDMPEVQFTELRAAQYYLSPNSSTAVSAIVENKCNLVSFQWNSTAGDMEGSDERITFTAPMESGDVTVSCTVSHPGREPVTRTVTIHIK